MHVFYLHGFASSAKSTKAAFLASKLREHGVPLHAPDFNEPDFSTLTVSRMVGQVRSAIAALPPGRVVLIGSSLGAFVAVQTAVAQAASGAPIDQMVLLAPALDFSGNRTRDLGDRKLAEWEATGQLNVFHYGFGRVMPVHYELFADACGYDCLGADLPMPILVFQGRRDTAVDPAMVEAWAHPRPNVELHLLDDDHQLGASLEYMWQEMRRFLEL
jgi:pimeloyl-ACP methyl ester carboxylesterase